jgi:TolB protein
MHVHLTRRNLPDSKSHARVTIYPMGAGLALAALACLCSNTSGEASEPTSAPQDTSTIAWDPAQLTGRIVFARQGAHAEIFVMDADGSNLVQLTSVPEGDNRDPMWSPGGSRIAFTGKRETTANPGIWVMDADGSDQTRLTPPEEGIWQHSPAWSPDGQQIAYLREVRTPVSERGAQLWVVNADGSDNHLLWDGAPIGKVDWSPDGTQLALTTRFSGNAYAEIAILDVATGELVRMTDNPNHDDSVPVWSPDGLSLAYVSNLFGDSIPAIALLPVDGGLPQEIDLGQVKAWSPAWSPDGDLIAFHSNRRGAGEGRFHIWVTDIAGGQAVQITDDPDHDDCTPDWTP